MTNVSPWVIGLVVLGIIVLILLFRKERLRYEKMMESNVPDIPMIEEDSEKSEILQSIKDDFEERHGKR